MPETARNLLARATSSSKPFARDNFGIALWVRPSDRILVYLACPVGGCQQFWGFESLEDLQKHVEDRAVHKVNIKLTSDAEVIELCSVIPREVGRGGVDIWPIEEEGDHDEVSRESSVLPGGGRAGMDVRPVKKKKCTSDEVSKRSPGKQSKGVEIIDLTGEED